ncbi:unnamed protein product [Schistosoma mattheei]|uniref:Uncharacterized protein n=1 Tax=Schistosoma mattheei TaxID=31246 RepID=A0A183PXH8_9TREM|nr:unnamed protein product [Schistosoma mattheei]
MEPAMEKLDIHSTSEDYFERFEIWAMTKSIQLIKNSGYAGKAHFASLYNYQGITTRLCQVCSKERKFPKMIHQDIKNSATLRHPNPVHTQGYAEFSCYCMAFPNDSHISDEISYKSEENMLNEPIHYQKPGAVKIDANFFNDSLLCNDILNKFHENVS